MMNEFLFNKPEVNPVSTCGTFSVSPQSPVAETSTSPNNSALQKSSAEKSGSGNVEAQSVVTPKQKKEMRKRMALHELIEANRERRHAEKMEKQERFLNLLEELVKEKKSKTD
jgi:hypothetical protein